MITPFDLFGEGKYCYTFVPCCKENKALEINDGAIRIFLNTRGTNDHEVSQELRDFLHYIETLDGSLVENSDSERLKKIHACVKQIKSSEEMGVKYMQKWEEKLLDQKEGVEIGRREGREEGLLVGLRQLMTKMDMSAEDALVFMGIPESEKARYLEKLEQE